MKENGSHSVGPEAKLTLEINGLIEKAKPGTSELTAMVDFSNIIMAKYTSKVLEESVARLDDRNLFVAYFQIARTRKIISNTTARINTKRMADPVYGKTVGLLIDTFNDDNDTNENPSLSATKNQLLLNILRHSLHD